jgi:anti-sigma B factor antagonist
LAQGQSAALTVRHEWDGGVAIVTVVGEIDMTSVGALSGVLGDLVRKDPERMIVDLAAVSFLDSSAIHAFVQTRHELPGACSVVLRSPQPQARRMFELTGLDSLCLVD